MTAFQGFFDYIPVEVDSMDYCEPGMAYSDHLQDKIWIQPHEKYHPFDGNCIFEVILGKKKKNPSFHVSAKRFYLTSTHLLYTKDATASTCLKIRGGIEMSWARVQFGPVDNEQLFLQGYFWKMSIVRNNRFTELYFKYEAEMLQLRNKIRPWCISEGFYDDFDLIGKIGSGAFASVSLNQKYFWFENSGF